MRLVYMTDAVGKEGSNQRASDLCHKKAQKLGYKDWWDWHKQEDKFEDKISRPMRYALDVAKQIQQE